MSEDKYEFEDDLYIDLNRLEWEGARQAKLFGKWGKRWSYATRKRDRALERVKTKRSELINYIQKNFREEGFNKEPTGPQAEAFYRTDEEYKESKREAIEAEFEVNLLYVSMRSFEHKRSMIGVEQKLFSDEYWSTPYEDPGFTEKTQKDMTEAQNEALSNASNRLPKKLIRRKQENGDT